MEKQINVKKEDRVSFHNGVDFCIGTGRMGLALTEEYQKELEFVQRYIGFSHIRGHGLFCDDMGIYQETPDGEAEYNFTYLDRVMDFYRSVGLKPFLELGFMPKKMASGTQTIFYWKGNTTPPSSYEKWAALIQATLTHLCERYGRDEVVTWPVEVWNEPNLPGFWEHADMEEYFRLFVCSFQAVKAVDERFRVGGPAVCGGTDEIWISAFLEFCHKEGIAIDFVTRHHYNTEVPETVGHYGYAELTEPQKGFDNLHTTREIIDRYPEYRGMEIHITEFNTSYIPNCPLHDTNQNAAYIAGQLAGLGEDNASYSYWTFGDVFEEFGVPFSLFHGGFGLVAAGCIPKPTFWSFVFFKELKKKAGDCVYRDEDCVIVKCEDGSYRGVAWNTTTKRCGRELNVSCTLPADAGRWCVISSVVDEENGNPLKAWHDLGEPAYPNQEQIRFLQETARPLTKTEAVESDGSLELSFGLKEHGVLYFSCQPAKLRSDSGYQYNRVMQK